MKTKVLLAAGSPGGGGLGSPSSGRGEAAEVAGPPAAVLGKAPTSPLYHQPAVE